ncbi:hypothetical protein NM688_g2253 [Phlebia brevispora]|uniref:Uncharacterized protein n=1 Tax=Phlebia brevispora TaxID=194682 RepID=A0ACC1T912_9APHY|nr:hypothetical protein NM688_g2253 [Phlebia brevispora]
MDSTESVHPSEVFAALVDSYAVVAASALAVYEFVLTTEYVPILWKGRHAACGWLLWTNRYVMLLGAIQAVAPYTHQVLTYVLYLLPSIITAVFSTLRVLALSDFKTLVAPCVILLSLVPVVLNTYRYSQAHIYYIDNTIIGVTLASRAAAIAADALVVIVTWRKTFSHARQAVRRYGYADFATTLFRDGSLYFIALLSLNVAQILLSTMATSAPTAESRFAVCLHSILISRFLVNLRQIDVSTDTSSKLSTLHDIIGNMGESLGDLSGDAQDDNADLEDIEDDNRSSVVDSEEPLIT